MRLPTFTGIFWSGVTIFISHWPTGKYQCFKYFKLKFQNMKHVTWKFFVGCHREPLWKVRMNKCTTVWLVAFWKFNFLKNHQSTYGSSKGLNNSYFSTLPSEVQISFAALYKKAFYQNNGIFPLVTWVKNFHFQSLYFLKFWYFNIQNVTFVVWTLTAFLYKTFGRNIITSVGRTAFWKCSRHMVRY